MYVHKFAKEDRLWTVGYYEPGGTWHAVSDHESEDEAGQRVAFLNGSFSELPSDQLDAIAGAVATTVARLTGLRGADLEQLQKRYDSLRELIVNLVNAWDAMGVMGFACKSQDRVQEFFTRIDQARSALLG